LPLHCRVSFEFQHNVCGRSIYAEGTVDAAMFLYTKVRIFNASLFHDGPEVFTGGR
jgi:4-hydroxy-tetrahydrodipicolinate reductase